VIIDESDGELDTFVRARVLGYGGVSSKNCKGFYKSIVNLARCRLWNAEGANAGYFLSGEDLTTQAGLSVQQDLALVALLGLADVTVTTASADGDLLRHAGVSSDSASRFLSLLHAAGIPSTIGGLPSAAVTDNVSFIGRFDHTPFDPTTLGAAKTTWGLTAYGKLSRSGALSTTPTATQSHGGKSGQDIGSLQAQYSTFFGSDYLADARTSFSVTRNQADPYLSLPDGRLDSRLALRSSRRALGSLSVVFRYELSAPPACQSYPPGATGLTDCSGGRSDRGPRKPGCRGRTEAGGAALRIRRRRRCFRTSARRCRARASPGGRRRCRSGSGDGPRARASSSAGASRRVIR
jgi:hypothetical protein